MTGNSNLSSEEEIKEAINKVNIDKLTKDLDKAGVFETSGSNNKELLASLQEKIEERLREKYKKWGYEFDFDRAFSLNDIKEEISKIFKEMGQ
jgi:hypothetical protein